LSEHPGVTTPEKTGKGTKKDMVLGIDLTDEYIALHVKGEENASVFPAAVCRAKGDDVWFVGEEAYRQALAGRGVMADKLLKLLETDGLSNLGGAVYPARLLLGKLLAGVLKERLKTADFALVEKLVITIRKADTDLMDRIMESLPEAGINPVKATVITHEEAFVHYTLFRGKEFYSSMVALFDLSGESLTYYEFMMVRGISRKACAAQGEETEEAFSADLLKKESGRALGDKIITDAAKKHMEGKLFSAVFLTGSGFANTDWAPSFLNFICQRRRVLQENGLFAVGAQILAAKLAAGEKEDCLIFCDSRVDSEVSCKISVHEKESRLILIPAGERWYGLQIHVEMIPQGQDYIDFDVAPFDSRKKNKTVRAELAGFPERPDRTTRLAVDFAFRSADKADVTITDLGFGELFPASGAVIHETIEL